MDVTAGGLDRVPTDVRCPYCFEWNDFTEALRSLTCAKCGKRLPKTRRLDIKHVYRPRE